MRAVLLTLMTAMALWASGRHRIITVTDTTDYTGPNIGSGIVGASATPGGMAAVDLFERSVVADGTASNVSTILRATEPVNVSINGHNLAGAREWSQSLDMDSAMIITRGIIDGLEVEARLMALRQLPHSILLNVRIRALEDKEVTVVNRPVIPVPLADGAVENRRVWCEDGGRHVQRSTATFNGGNDVVASTSLFMAEEPWTIVSGSEIKATLRKGELTSFAIAGNVVATADFRDPANESERMALFAARQSSTTLMAEHRRRWERLWESAVEIGGDRRLQEITDVATYNIYSSIADNAVGSVAPMGLTSDKYSGHIFWDADFWIHPVVAALHPRLARGMVDFRLATLPEARRRAQAYGYSGAMYPWEADRNGEEATPTFALTGPLEHHITADVAIAAWTQYRAEGDSRWLREAYPMIAACADFWVSRSTLHDDGSRSIDNVVGADEYAIGVDNNAFTNGAAIKALMAADSAARELGITPPPEWLDAASKISFARNADGIILEYDGYDGAMIKQADAVLLAYPLNLITDSAEIRRTIEFYDPYLDKEHGPAMSHAVMAVNYARTGDGLRAYETLMKGVDPYMRGPFHSFAETPSNGATYFMTGAGALLQGLIFGFAAPGAALPPHISSVSLLR